MPCPEDGNPPEIRAVQTIQAHHLKSILLHSSNLTTHNPQTPILIRRTPISCPYPMTSSRPPHRHPCSAPCPIRQKVPQLHIHASLQPPTLPPFSSFHSQEPHKTTPPPENSHIHKNHPVSISSQNFQYTRHLIKLLCSEFSERD
ncbi:hypothetical protein J0A71_07g14570 [Encephalitozoon cuniculi]|nr:hypothetical protein J0A71_06g14450 [Encephalitozoon cuniculi]UYI27580.1 hypothetical protein J0A71_07g14570 [Encephalitozoon cuniculi]